MNQLVDLATALFVDEDGSYDFHTASSRACTTPNGAHQNKHDREKRGPPVKSGGGITRRSGD